MIVRRVVTPAEQASITAALDAKVAAGPQPADQQVIMPIGLFGRRWAWHVARLDVTADGAWFREHNGRAWTRRGSLYAAQHAACPDHTVCLLGMARSVLSRVLVGLAVFVATLVWLDGPWGVPFVALLVLLAVQLVLGLLLRRHPLVTIRSGP
jgi:hypothetical protein